MSNEGFPDAEPAAQSLFESFHGQEVTFRGVTATIGVLINLCPKPLSEMDPAQVEVWTADILTQSGVEIPETFQDALDAAKKKLN